MYAAEDRTDPLCAPAPRRYRGLDHRRHPSIVGDGEAVYSERDSSEHARDRRRVAWHRRPSPRERAVRQIFKATRLDKTLERAVKLELVLRKSCFSPAVNLPVARTVHFTRPLVERQPVHLLFFPRSSPLVRYLSSP
jgi:hypothetical protein